MTITERFDRCAERLARIEAVDAELKALKDENAADRQAVLDWFRSRKPDGGRHRGIIYTKTRQRRLDATLARQLLGARAAEAEKLIEPESLKIDPEAKSARRPAAAKLTPVRGRQRAKAAS